MKEQTKYSLKIQDSKCRLKLIKQDDLYLVVEDRRIVFKTMHYLDAIRFYKNLVIEKLSILTFDFTRARAYT